MKTQESKKKDYLSVSQINQYRRCSMQYFFRYIQDIKIPPNSNLVVGSCLHKALEFNFFQKIESKQDRPVQEILKAFSKEFETKKLGVQQEKDWSPDEEEKKAHELLELYIKDYAPAIQPVLVEAPFIIYVEGIKIKGRMDLATDEKLVLDFKSAAKSYQEDAAQDDLQLMTYALAFKEMTGFEAASAGFDVLIKTKKAKIQQVRTKEFNFERFTAIVLQVNDAITQGIFFPCDQSQACSYCDYKKDYCKIKK